MYLYISIFIILRTRHLSIFFFFFVTAVKPAFRTTLTGLNVFNQSFSGRPSLLDSIPPVVCSSHHTTPEQRKRNNKQQRLFIGQPLKRETNKQQQQLQRLFIWQPLKSKKKLQQLQSTATVHLTPFEKWTRSEKKKLHRKENENDPSWMFFEHLQNDILRIRNGWL